MGTGLDAKVADGPTWRLKAQLRKHGFDHEPDKKSIDFQPKGTVESQASTSCTLMVRNIYKHFRKGCTTNRELLGKCAQEVDKTLSVMVQLTKNRLTSKIDNLETRLLVLEKKMRRLCEAVEEKGRRMLREAKRTADSEREEKALLCQWLNGFLVSCPSEPRLSSMDFTFARFALNVAVASARTRTKEMLDAGAPAFLVGMLSNPNELVTGPAVLALAQMAQHDTCRHGIVQAGGVPPLVLLCFKNQSPAVLTQVCIALALLSQHAPNKPIIAGKGGVAAMVRLLEGFVAEDRVTVEVAGKALAGLVNVVHGSDANRGLAEECGLASPTIKLMDAVDDEFLLVQACRALGNMAFRNQYTALRLLEAGADRAICELVRDSDKTRHSDMMEAGFIALANLANNRLNQAHVGAGSTIELALAVCQHCRSPRVVRTAALALSSLCYKCQANKTRCAALDAESVLLELGVSWGVTGEDDATRSQQSSESLSGGTVSLPEDMVDDQCVAAAQAICCLAILAQHPTNALALKELGGMTQLTEIIEESEHNKVLIAAAKAVVSLIPEPDALVRAVRNGRTPEVEEAGAYEALVRVKEWVFGQKAVPPWLMFALDLLGCEVDAIEARLAEDGPGAFRKPSEFFAPSEFFEEGDTPIPPDATLANEEDFGEMLFHVF